MQQNVALVKFEMIHKEIEEYWDSIQENIADMASDGHASYLVAYTMMFVGGLS
jgi:hypothetical protein